MRLTIDLPATLDELARFIAAAEALDVPDDATPSFENTGVGMGAMTLDLGTASHTERDLPEPDPIPPVLAAAEKAAPAKAPKAAKRAAKTAPAEAKAPGKPTGYLAAVLNLIADHGGTWEGSAASLGSAVHPANPESGKATVRNAEKKGWVSLTKDGNRVRAVSITRAGYEAIDRVPTASVSGLPALTEPDPDAEVVPMPEVGPIERRPFDPDRARQSAAAAL